MKDPGYLYKYRTLAPEKTRQYTRRIFTHNELYFARPLEFNDPFDTKFYMSLDGTDEECIAWVKNTFPKLSLFNIKH